MALSSCKPGLASIRSRRASLLSNDAAVQPDVAADEELPPFGRFFAAERQGRYAYLGRLRLRVLRRTMWA